MFEEVAGFEVRRSLAAIKDEEKEGNVVGNVLVGNAIEVGDTAEIGEDVVEEVG